MDEVCTKCTSVNESGAKFCRQCGHQLELSTANKTGSLRSSREKYLNTSTMTIVGIVVAILASLIYMYINGIGIFYRPYKVNSNLYNINFPGEPKKYVKTYGTAESPYIQTTYTYTTDSSSFVFQEDDFQGSIDEAKFDELFSDSVNRNLNQNTDVALEKYPETIVSQTPGKFLNYPTIDAKLKIDGLNIYAHERFIKVGHIIYWIKSSQVGAEPKRYEVFMDSFQLKLLSE